MTDPCPRCLNGVPPWCKGDIVYLKDSPSRQFPTGWRRYRFSHVDTDDVVGDYNPKTGAADLNVVLPGQGCVCGPRCIFYIFDNIEPKRGEGDTIFLFPSEHDEVYTQVPASGRRKRRKR